MSKLDDRFLQMVANAYAPGTVRNFKTCWTAYLRFAITHRLQLFPPCVDTLVRFYTSLTDSLRAFRSLQNYQSAIVLFYKLYGMEVDMSLVQYKLLNMAARKSLSTVPATKTPLEPEHIIRFIELADPNNPFEFCFVTSVTVGFFCITPSLKYLPTFPQEF